MRTALWLGLLTACNADIDPDTDDTDVVDTDPVDPYSARYDCGAMDPADPAPLGGYVALTFDDGPSIGTTPAVVDVLRRNQVPATFFYIGEMASDPAVDDLIADVAADPLFDIGNHSWSHPVLAYEDDWTARSEIDDGIDALADHGVTPRYFRFPYGYGTCSLVDHARERGMHVTGWHIDTADWCYASGGGSCSPGAYWRVPDEYRADMVANTVDQIVESDGGTVLFHDVWAFTADQLESVILELKADGFRFTSLDDARAFPRLNRDDPYPFPWIGQACPVDTDPCWQIENFSWCEPTGDPTDDNAGVCVLPCDDAPCFSRDGGPPSVCVGWEGASVCLGASDRLNGWCAGVPGTVATDVDGQEVCLPATWL